MEEKLVAVKAFVPESTRNAFKAVCAKQGVSMSDTLTAFIEQVIEQDSPNPKQGKKTA